MRWSHIPLAFLKLRCNSIKAVLADNLHSKSDLASRIALMRCSVLCATPQEEATDLTIPVSYGIATRRVKLEFHPGNLQLS